MKRIKTKYPCVYYIIGKAVGTGKPERIYYIRYRKDGKEIEEKAGRQFQDHMTPALAAQTRTNKIQRNQPTNRERREAEKAQKEAEESRWTVDRLWKEYKKNNPNLKGWHTYESAYKLHIKPNFANNEPKDILPLDILRIKNKLIKKRSPQTVFHVIEQLRRIINFGVNNKLCKGLDFKINKKSGLMPKVDNIKTEDLTNAQLVKLLKAIDADEHPQAGPMIKLALFSGMRRGEMFKLRWRHIDFDRGFINIIDPKGGQDQTIPLNESARELLEDHPRTEGSPFVFPGRNGGQRVNIGKQVRKIADDAKLPKTFRPLHGCRHVYASMLASSGKVDFYVLQRLLTHKNPQTTQRYAHLRDDTLKRASGVAVSIIEEAVKGTKEDKQKIVNLKEHPK